MGFDKNVIFQKEKKMIKPRRVKKQRKHKPYKPRNVNRAARRSQIVFPLRRIVARNIMDEMKIPDRRR